jgi:hypothetical protein
MIALLTESSRQLAVELEFNYSPEDVKVISPEALAVLEQVNTLFSKIDLAVPDEVAHVLGQQRKEGSRPSADYRCRS